MNDPAHHSRPEERSDEASRLWLAMVDQAGRMAALHRQLAAIKVSRSWRVTAPLRALLRWFEQLRGGKPSRPGLLPAGRTDVAGHRDHVVPSWVSIMLPGPDHAQPRWLIDVTELSLEDLGAGVQRVTGRLLTELLMSPPDGGRVEPVRLAAQGHYSHAREFVAVFLGMRLGAPGGDDPVEPRGSDRFVGLDFCRDRAAPLESGLKHLRDQGVWTSLLVHDTLPLTHPQWFPQAIGANFESWLRVLSKQADHAVCVSEQTAIALRQALGERGLALPPCGIGVVPLGSDLLPMPPLGITPEAKSGVLRVVTVGTIEPRKGHRQAVDALKAFWTATEKFEWLIVGRRGWQTESLVDRLEGHPELGRRLHWLDDADDGVLGAIYRSSDVLLMPSQGEGYGLPLAEAGALGLGLVLRDLPVFHEVAGDAAAYFHGDAGEDIANALRAWRDRPHKPTPKAWATWAQSAEALETIIASARTISPDRPRMGDQHEDQ